MSLWKKYKMEGATAGFAFASGMAAYIQRWLR
jgi:cystathionine beta-lyase/cystathionine gamma-synthase